MQLTEAMRTAFTCREFTDEPVTDAALHCILDAARFAPSGGNRQRWRVIVVRESRTKAEIARLMEPAIKQYVAQRRAGENPWNTVEESAVGADSIEATPPPGAMTDTIALAPVVLLVCVDLGVVASMDRHLDRVGVTSGASIYPFVWNTLLAARGEGYAGAITTFITAAEPAAKKLLGIPDRFAIAAALPLGRPLRPLTRLRRRPVEAFAMREGWAGPPLGAGEAQ